jgi:transposase InsO family protein
MERFWGTNEHCRDSHCRRQLIADIIQQYNTWWIHQALRTTLEAARTAGIYCECHHRHHDPEEFELGILITVNHLSLHAWNVATKIFPIAIRF